MSKKKKIKLVSVRSGASSGETTVTRRASPSSSVAFTPKQKSRDTSATSDTIPSPENPKASRRTVNSQQDVINASRLIQALAAALGDLVRWKKIRLKDGSVAYALIFPSSLWRIEDDELLPR